MKKIISFATAILLTACALLGVGFVGAEGETATKMISEDFQNCVSEAEFSSSSEGINCSYFSSDSNCRIVRYPLSVNGTCCLMANKLDMRWWNIEIKDNAYRFDISVKIDENFDNTFKCKAQSDVPSDSGNKSETAVVFTVSPDESGEPCLYDGCGTKLCALPLNKEITISASLTRGSDKETITIGSESYDGSVSFDFYDIVCVSLQVNPGTAKGIETPYIMIDNIGVYSVGRTYPQAYSMQEIGDPVDVTLPETEEITGYTVFVNSTRIYMEYAPETVDGKLYVDLTQLAYSLGLSLTENNGTYTLGDTLAEFKIGETTVKTASANVETVGAPLLLHRRPFVSLNFVNEVLNAKVWQDDEHQMVVFTFGEKKNDGILRVVGGVLYMNGEPYYEISFNKFDLFYQIIAQYNGDASYPSYEYQAEAAEEALAQLHELGFTSIRVFAFSSTYADLMYNEEHQEIYFKAMDQMFDLCDKYDIKVVVCMGLIESHLTKCEVVEDEGTVTGTETIIDIVSDPDSESRQNVYKYIDMFVNRYKDRDSILMWEIRNEAALEADIGDTVGKMKYSLGQLAEFYSSVCARIRQNDPDHLISSGDATLRSAQWHLYESVCAGNGNDWTVDTAEERLKALWLLNQSFDVISTHPYGLGISDTSCYKDEDGNNVRCTYQYYMDEAAALGKVLYNGECNTALGLSDENFYTATQDYLDAIIDSGVQITHWWTFRSDRQGFNDGYLWTISDGELLDMLVAANKTIKERWCVNSAAYANTDTLYGASEEEVFDISKLTDGSANVPSKTETASRRAVPFIAGGIGVACIAGGTAAVILVKKRKKKNGTN